MKKSVYLFLFIISLSFFTTYKAFIAYTAFNKNNIPVYDGVMYEKNQMRTYFKFKNNFSFKERLNQAYYEFKGNGLNPGFNCAVILINPQWLVSDTDIILRGFLSVFVFALILFDFLRYRTNTLNSIIIVCLIFQLPLFYNFRYGITTYIPEIPSALFLLAGYIQMLNFFRTEKLFSFFSACILIIVSIMFRMNFFVYAFFFSLPLFYKSFLIIKSQSAQKKAVTLSFIFLVISFLSFYFFSHLGFFIGYYRSEIPYELTSYPKAFVFLFKNFHEQIGFLGLILLCLIFILANNKKATNENNFNKAVYTFYPFLFHFSFIILYLKAGNIPHVISAMVVFLSFLFTIPSKFAHAISIRINDIGLRIIAIIVFVLLNVQYMFACNSYEQTFPEYTTSKNVVEYIKNDTSLSRNYKYICFYNEMAETPIDVMVYRHTNVWLNSSDHFYLHDIFLYNLTHSLNDTLCSTYYIKKIKDRYYDLIIINDSTNTFISSYPLASKINNTIRKYMQTTRDYSIAKQFTSFGDGKILIYQRKK